MRLLRKIVLALIVVVLVGAAMGWYMRRDSAPQGELRTAPVRRGDLVATIGATGTVEPEEVIDVGAQVAGQIISFGLDTAGKPVDYGSHVNEGMVLAKIDDAIYTADVTEAAAQLEQAKAGVSRAEADLKALQSKLDQAQRDWDRAQKLGPSDALAQTTYDSYRAAYEQAKANIAVGQAAIVQARATVEQNQSTLARAQRNLGYCTIKSPVTGVIIDRRVNIGQTVVSSLNAPSLFLLAKDLRHMAVWVAVNEADIGSIHPGQRVTFTVDAFPDRTFEGKVNKIRLNASMTQNVVTYTVEVETDNAEQVLLPYLTANVQFETSRRDHVLLVPNAALRWIPSEERMAPEARSEESPDARPGGGGRDGGGREGNGREGGERHEKPATQPAAAAFRAATLWVADGQYVRPVPVEAGLTDGAETEVRGSGVHDGMQVIIAEAPPGTGGGFSSGGGQPTSNPFLPQFRRRGRR